MKNWNVPAMKELDVRLTASGSAPSTVEYNYSVGNYSGTPSHNAATHEYNVESQCISPIKTTTES